MVLLFIRVFTKDVLNKVNFRLKLIYMGTHNPTQFELRAWVYFKIFLRLQEIFFYQLKFGLRPNHEKLLLPAKWFF